MRNPTGTIGRRHQSPPIQTIRVHASKATPLPDTATTTRGRQPGSRFRRSRRPRASDRTTTQEAIIITILLRWPTIRPTMPATIRRRHQITGPATTTTTPDATATRHPRIQQQTVPTTTITTGIRPILDIRRPARSTRVGRHSAAATKIRATIRQSVAATAGHPRATRPRLIASRPTRAHRHNNSNSSSS